MKSRDHRRIGRSWVGLETLEPRCLLSGNGVIDVTQGLLLLQVAIASSFKVPATPYLSGTGQVMSLPLEVTDLNMSEPIGGGQAQTIAVPAAQTTSVTVVAHPVGAEDDSQDVTVGSLSTLAIGGLKVGATKNFVVPLTIPGTVGGMVGNRNDWVLVVTLNPDGALAELGENPGNLPVLPANTSQTAPFVINQGLPALSVTAIDHALPTSIVSGGGQTFTLPFTITNQGTWAVGAGVTTTVQVVLASTLSGLSAIIDTGISVNVSGLRPHASVSGVATVDFTNQVNDLGPNDAYPTDVQDFVLTVDPGQLIPQLSGANNSFTTKTVDVTVGVYSLAATPQPNPQLPTTQITSGTGQPISASVLLKNVGSIIRPSTDTYPDSVTLAAVPEGNWGNPQVYTEGDVNLNSPAQISIPTLPIGKSGLLKLSGLLPLGMPTGSYKLYVLDSIEDPNNVLQNNYWLVANQSINVTEGYVDLAPTLAGTVHLPSNAVSGSGQVYTLPLVITNNGNQALPQNTAVTVQLALTDPTAEFTPVNLGGDTGVSVTLPAIGAGKQATVNVPYTLPIGTGLPGQVGQFQIVATLTVPDSLMDAGLNDKTAPATASFAVTDGGPDLVLNAPANLKVPAAVTTGAADATFKLALAAQNTGTLALASTAAPIVDVFLTPSAGGTPIQVAQFASTTLGGLGLHASRNITIPVTLTSALATGSYTLSAEIDPDNALQELTTANDTLDLGTIQVTQGLATLTATINATALQGVTLTSGATPTITLPITLENTGNLPVPLKQLVNLVVTAVNTSGGSPITIATLSSINFGGLKPGASRTINATFKLPDSIAGGQYQFAAAATWVAPTAADGTNINATAPAATVTQDAPSLVASFGSTLNLPTALVSGNGAAFALPLVITNSGTLAVPGGAQIGVTITIHNQADGDDTSSDAQLTELLDLNIGGLAIGQSKDVSFTLTLPPGLGPGDYVVVATVDSQNQLPQLSTSGNTAETGPLTVAS